MHPPTPAVSPAYDSALPAGTSPVHDAVPHVAARLASKADEVACALPRYAMTLIESTAGGSFDALRVDATMRKSPPARLPAPSRPACCPRRLGPTARREPLINMAWCGRFSQPASRHRAQQ